MWILWQEHAQHGPVETLALCCAWTRMWFHAFPLCLLIGFVARDLHSSVVVVCRLFVSHCDVYACSTHAHGTTHQHYGSTLVKLARANETDITVALYQYI